MKYEVLLLFRVRRRLFSEMCLVLKGTKMQHKEKETIICKAAHSHNLQNRKVSLLPLGEVQNKMVIIRMNDSKQISSFLVDVITCHGL